MAQNLTIGIVDHRALWSETLRQLRQNIAAMLSLMVLVLLAVVAIFAHQIAPYDPNDIDLFNGLQSPFSSGHLLGTDDLGRDVLSRLIHGSRTSLVVGFIVVGIAGSIGVTLGAISGYFGGAVDMVIMRIVDLLFAFPFLILALAFVAILGPSLTNMMLALGLVSSASLSIARRLYPRCRALAARDDSSSWPRERWGLPIRIAHPGTRHIWVPNVVNGIVDKDGVDMEEVIVNTFNIASLDRVAEIVITQLQEVGIPAVPEVVEFSTWADMYINAEAGSQVGQRRVRLWGGCGGPAGMDVCWGAQSGFAAVMGFEDEEVFAAIELANQTPDFDERDAIMETAVRKVFGEQFNTINASPPIRSVTFAASYVKDYGLPWGFDNVCTTNNNLWLDK